MGKAIVMNESMDIFDRIMALPGFRTFGNAYRKYKEMLLYIFFGACTTGISIGTFYLSYSVFHINELIANGISWICAVAFSYVTSRIWVFRSRCKGLAALKELISFLAARLATLGIEEAAMLIFVTWWQFDGTVVKIILQFVVLVSNYLLSKLVVFKGGKTDE